MAATQQVQMGGTPFVCQTIPPPIPFSRKWHIAKIVIRGWSCLFAVIVLILDIVLVAKANNLLNKYLADNLTSHSLYYSYDGYTFSLILWLTSLPSVGLVICWDVVEFITLCVRRKTTGRGIHPGAHVGVDLILWIVLLIAGGSLAAFVSGYYDYYDYDSSTGSYVVSDDYDPSPRAIGIALIVLLILLFIIHFFLFVRACIETHQRNKAKRIGSETIMVISPEAGGSQHPYYTAGTRQTVTWFQPGPIVPQTKESRRNPQSQSTAAGVPDPNVEASTRDYGNYYAPQPPPPAQNTHLSGFYAPQNSHPHMSGYYAPSTPRSVEAVSPEMSQPRVSRPEPVEAGSSAQSEPARAGPFSSEPRPGTAK